MLFIKKKTVITVITVILFVSKSLLEHTVELFWKSKTDCVPKKSTFSPPEKPL